MCIHIQISIYIYNIFIYGKKFLGGGEFQLRDATVAAGKTDQDNHSMPPLHPPPPENQPEKRVNPWFGKEI